MKNFRFAASVTALLLMPTVAWSSSQCTMQDLQNAASDGYTFSSWQALYDSYVRFGHCDKGGDASEGYSEAVVRLLVDHWSELPKLAALFEKHEDFKGFVLRHIDATADDADLKNISRFAQTQCPADIGCLCTAVDKNAEKALEENGSGR